MIRKQKITAFSVTLALVMTVGLFNPREVLAAADYETFRQDLITFVETYGNGTNTSAKLITDMWALSYEELVDFHSMLPDPSVFAQASARANASPALQRELELPWVFGRSDLPESHPPAAGFPPDYPSGGNYSVYTATLPGLGILLAGPQNRTDASAVGGALLASDVLELAAISAQAVCDGALLGAPAACALAVIANLAARADQVVLNQADYQDALIDGAEIEAAYENSVIIIGQGNDLNVDLATHDTDIKGLLTVLQAAVDANSAKLDTLLERQLETIRLLHTPEGRRGSDVPACNGGPCDWPQR